MAQTRYGTARRLWDSVIRQLLGLPHNKTLRYVQKQKQAISPDTLKTIGTKLIAEATAIAPSQVNAWYDQAPNAIDEISSTTEQWWRSRIRGLMGINDRITLYVLLKAFQPRICVETGTSGGASATIILSAIQVRDGQMHSIEIASNDQDRYGELIPAELKPHWTLHLQTHTSILPSVLDDLASIDFFLHDSDHHFRHMQWEFETVWPYIKSGGVLASHDILYNTAFNDFRERYAPDIAGGGSIGNFGFLVKK